MRDLLARLMTIWDGLSGRERILVAAVGASFAGALFFFSVVSPIVSMASESEMAVRNGEQNVLVMARLRREYEAINMRLVGVEERIRSNRDKQNTLTLLENLAKTSGVKIDSMQERKSPDHALYREARVEVALKKVTLSQVVSFLHSIESNQRQFSVKGLRIKTRNDQNELLDVNFSVSSFEAI